jgi:hypothetical protein
MLLKRNHFTHSYVQRGEFSIISTQAVEGYITFKARLNHKAIDDTDALGNLRRKVQKCLMHENLKKIRKNIPHNYLKVF